MSVDPAAVPGAVIYVIAVAMTALVAVLMFWNRP